jgi:hypothetical protein
LAYLETHSLKLMRASASGDLVGGKRGIAILESLWTTEAPALWVAEKIEPRFVVVLGCGTAAAFELHLV